ncbi:MAG: DMT family transporter [Actinobacteria bacterium]|nr:DMT family transporter [Actinomycetota bacterium]
MSRRNWFLFFFVGFIWGIPYLLIKVAVEDLSPPVIVFARVAIGAAILIPIAVKHGSLMPAIKAWKYVIPYAIGEMIGPWFLITAAEQKMTSGLTGLLVATVPIWTTILASLHGDKTVWHHKRLLGILIGFIGIILVVGIESFSGRQSIVAIAMVLIASIGYSWAVTMITAKVPHIEPISINGVAMVFTAIVYLPFVFLNAPEHMPSAKVLGSVLVLGLFPTAMAFILFFQLVKDIGTARGSLVTYLNTAFAVVLGVIILREPFTLGIALGLPLVLIGSYFASRKTVTSAQ